MFKVELVADLCEAIAEFIHAEPGGAELTARKLAVVLRSQGHRERERELENAERERRGEPRF